MGTIEMRTSIPGPRSQEVLARTRRVVADAFDIHAPAFIATGRGAAFTDIDGNTLLDFSGGLGCNLVGHSHPKVVDAVQRQARHFSHTDFTVVPYEELVRLAERLSALVGDGYKAAFFNAGAEAVENAVKIARVATGRPAVICFERAFHGRTMMALTMTSRQSPYKAGFGPFAPEVYRVPFPYPYRSHDPERAGADALAALEEAFHTLVDPHAVAAVVVEPVQGEGGFVVPPPDYLPGLADVCRAHGIVLVADEIQTGCGRTGRFLASEHFGVEADVVLLAKALGAGYPISAVVGRAEVMDAAGAGALGGTYVGNPVACAAANAVLDVIEEEDLMARAEHLGKAITGFWEEMSDKVALIGEVRGLGSMVGVELVTDRATKEPATAALATVVRRALDGGVVGAPCGVHSHVLRHLMPLVITDDELVEGLGVLGDAVLAASSTSA